ncbi:unnamed protein product [Chironomus riparius]|uniref:Uncharacterized protein n=1 Tax=Chironomus riparius TaxID=315576 RepID=A0A9N9WPK5_9DIPT|nr:unnamed protein product [Chironomus riparius]
MKVVLCLFACLAYAAAFPHPQGQDFNNEAIRQAQQSHLIPHNAIIHGVEKSVPLAAYENIPVGQRVDLFMILGDQIPREVAENLQEQIDRLPN